MGNQEKNIAKRIASLENKLRAKNRELEIESAVERVRVKALAMHRSEEISDVANVLRTELGNLNIPGIAAATITLLQENGKIRLWDITSVIELKDGFHFSMDIMFDLKETKPTDWIRRIWDGKGKYFIYKQDKKKFKRTLAWTSKYNPEFAKNAKIFLETNKIKASWHPVVPLSHGKLSLDLLQEPVAEVKPILIKMGAAFDLAYKRFLDLKNAEAQVRESQIEAALERVRSRTMAMHQTSELQEVIHVVHRELLNLDISIVGGSFVVINEDVGPELRCWGSGGTANTSEEVHVPHFNMPFVTNLIKSIKRGPGFFTEEFSQKEKKEYFSKLFKHKPWSEISNAQKKETLSTAGAYSRSVAVSKHTTIFIINHSGRKFTEAENDILKRFAKVFEQTYTRFLDLKNAEAQAREAQIEAALERVRARTMGMHHSKELHDVIETVTNQLLGLGLEFNSANFCRINKDKSWELWLSTPQQAYPSIIHVPYLDHGMFHTPYSDIDFFTDVYDQKSAIIFFHHFFENTDARHASEERKQFVYNSKGFSRSGFLAKDIWVVVSRYDIIPFTDGENGIIKRFAKVFEQSYTRFLDLQKAEAQAKEAEIELALERVRAKTMAMQKPAEFVDVANEIGEQLVHLDFDIEWVNFSANGLDVSKGIDIWNFAVLPGGQHISSRLFIPYFEHSVFTQAAKELDEYIRTGKDFFITTLNKKDKDSWLDQMYTQTFFKDVPEELKAIQYGKPGYTTSNIGLKDTWLSIGKFDTKTFTNEQHAILRRFGKAFGLAYTRFQDLQKAETQAREAQIQLSLERVRARAMAMHHSDELNDVLSVLFEQFDALNINPVFAHLSLFDLEKNLTTLRITGKGGKRSMVQKTVPIDAMDEWKEELHNWKASKPSSFSRIYYTKDVLPQIWNLFGDLFDQFPNDSKIYPEDFPDGLYCIQGNTGFGYIGLNHTREATEEEKDIILRFATEFGRVYQRFLDLQKAEAQARESQIEVGLERVRSRAMAMQTSEELNALIGTVFTELTKLDLVLTRCIIWVFDAGTNDVRWWMANSEEPSNPMSFLIKYHEHPAYLTFVNEWKNQNVKFIYDLKGKDKKSWDKILFNKTELKNLPDVVKNGMQAPERVLLSASFNNFGGINVASLEPLSDEHFNILLRFAKVFDLTYTRFNDLKQAEAQAREAKIEAALERVRSRTMAMHRSEEIADIVGKIFTELQQLDLVLNRVLIWIFNDAEKYISWWSANPEAKNNAESYRIDYNKQPVFLSYLKAWQKRVPLHLYTLSGDNKKNWEEHLFSNTELSKLPIPVRKGMKSEGIIFTTSTISDYGLMMVGSFEPLSNENTDIIQRFGRVFQQSYTRYLDVQKAEEQARESQIQLALERVRAKTMAMQKSNELQEVVNSVYERLNELEVRMDGAAICTFIEGTKDYNVWIGDYQEPLRIKFNEFTQVQRDYNDAIEKREELFTNTYSGEIKKEYIQFLLEQTVLGINIPEEQKQLLLTSEFFTTSLACTKNTVFQLYRYTENSFSKEENDILKRFANIFEQSYTRFLDLQKAEAQARESQIQLALERVRARTMAMQKSDELPDTSRILYEQMKELGEPGEQLTIGVVHEENKVIEISATLYGEILKKVYQHSIDEPFMMSKIYHAWKTNQKTLIVELKGDELNAYNKYRNELTKTEMFPTDLGDEHRRIVYAAFFSKGMLALGANEPRPPESLQLLERFAGVFDQAYIRFIDLKKAEEQARESQIQLALERVRARTMAMQKSEELPETSLLLFQQMKEFGETVVQNSIGIIKEEEGFVELSTTVHGHHEPKTLHVPINDPHVMAKAVAAWKAKRKSLTLEFKGQELKDYNELRNSFLETKVDFPEDNWVVNLVFFSKGWLSFSSNHEISKESFQLLERFAGVFDLTYTRFLDLKQAEAQARESQIQLALERVRARTMAMQHSDELSETSHVLFQQFRELGEGGDQISIGIFEEDEKSMNLYSTFQGSQWNRPARIEFDKHHVYKNVYAGWKDQKKSVITELTGKELQELNKIKLENPDYQVSENELAKDHWVVCTAYFSNGVLSYASHESPAKESIELLERFASVFDLTYTRFLDLKKAEGQAREAQIETALERVRAVAMAMRKPEELMQISEMIYEQLQLLGFEKLRNVQIAIDDDEKKTYNGVEYSEYYQNRFKKVPYDSSPLFSEIAKEIKRSHTAFYQKEITGHEFEDWRNWRTNIQDREDSNIHPGLATATSMCFYLHSVGTGMLGISTFKPISNEQLDILKRFKNVFELSYRRYIDIEKAEMQAREAQIELALERVRARTMAMHRSEELAETAQVLFQQLNELNVVPDRIAIGIADETNNVVNFWSTDQAGSHIKNSFRGRLDERTVMSKGYRAWKDHQRSLVVDLQGDDLKEWIQFAREEMKIPVDEKFIKDRRVHSFAFFSHGWILVTTHEPQSAEAIQILERFASVFNLTYRRFLDLEKAEAQAKEARIEMALERIRARALAMHSSNELIEVTKVMREQMAMLGQPELESTVVHLYEEDPDHILSWRTFRLDSDTKNEIVHGHMSIPKNSHGFVQEWLKMFYSDQNEYTIELSGTKQDEWYKILGQFAPDVVTAMEKDHSIREARYYQFAKFSGGALLMISKQQPSEEAKYLLKKASVVFGLAYRRFTDLQKAEAQAREAQIEAALERVRARTMAMFKSDELAETAAVVFKQLIELGIEPHRLYIGIINNESGEYEFWITDEEGNKVSNRHIVSVHKNISIKKMYDGWKEQQKTLSIDMVGDELNEWLSYWNKEFGVPFKQGAGQQRRVQNLAYFSKGFIATTTFGDAPKEIVSLLNRFAAVFNLTYTRFNDLQQAEAQAKEAQIEAGLERVRARTMAMHTSNDVSEATATMFTELEKLGIQNLRAGITIIKPDQTQEVWAVTKLPDGQAIRSIGVFDMRLHPLWIQLLKAKENKVNYQHYWLAGKDKDNYIDILNATPNYLTQPIKEFPDAHVQFYMFGEGAIWTNSLQPHSEEDKQIMQRFASVFSLTFRRYEDLRKAEAQAKEATIEAALEKVRGKAMAMHNSNDLSVTASMVITELRKLGINPIRCGVGILSKETHKAQLYTATTSAEGDSLSVVGHVLLEGHPVLEKIYQTWTEGEDYFPELIGDSMRSYYEQLLSGLSVPLPDFEGTQKHYGHFFSLSVGCLYAWSDVRYNDDEIKILRRFASIIDLTFRRYFELQKSEANAREAVKQAALDRVRADIASMRTISDLDRITPLIWNELTILGIPFIRCGVFIMDEAQQLIHTFLSTPDGKAIAAFHLPYDTTGNLALVVSNWKAKKKYIDHWDEKEFYQFAEILVQQGALDSAENYLKTIPKGGFDLHFLPFLQGMLYVGNTSQLDEEQIELIQHVADAFSTAYARYEDFNRLEAAKQQVENTLSDLKQAQQQLVQSEKMASLGELTAGIAHEIQNPLNFVNNFSDVSSELLDEMKKELEKGNKEDAIAIVEDVKQNLEKILHHGQRADAIVKGMLQHSRTSSGQKEMTDINVLADEYLRLAFHGLRAKDKTFNAKFETHFDNNIGKVNIIPQDIGRVILNLINNAFYAVTEKKKKNDNGYEPTVTVTTLKDNGRVEIKVKDNGNGIPQKILDKIFQPFFTTKPTGQGTGLGLSLAYDIVTKGHGGELKVETKEGEGSQFIIVL